MNLKRWLIRLLVFVGAVLALIAVAAAALWLYFHPSIERRERLVYGRRLGQDLTFDVVRPLRPNGLGVALMVSGGWKSGTNAFHPWMVAPLLRRGYTVFAVCHVSQPEATVIESFEDVSRGVRYIRAHAKEFGIDPKRLGVTGGSAGGHLSLMLATRGGPGPADAPDPVDRESSAVQTVAIFYPVTDLLNLGPSTENLHDDGPPKSFVKAFGMDRPGHRPWAEIGREMSPLFFVASNLPPTLIYHGDADTLVPLEQSQRYQAKAREMGDTVELVVHHGGKHGWLSMLWDLLAFADWFDRYLPSSGK
jgi:acetyl esterase/lipase